MSEDGVGELVDFMPVTPGGRATDRRRIVRAVRVVRGRMSFVLECDPRFDYGRRPHEVEVTEEGASFRTDDLTLTLHAYGLTPTRDKRGVRAVLELGEGEIAGAMLETGGSGKHRRPRPRDLRALFDETEEYWKRWLARSGYRGRWRDMVNRSAITLKLMIYEPTGAPGGRADRGPARAGRGRAQLGLPLHVGPRRLVLGRGAARPGLHRRGGGVRPVDRRPHPGAGGERGGSSPDHVPDRRLAGSRRVRARPHGGLPRVGPGAHRQRRRRPGAAGHLRRDGGRPGPRR